MFLQKWQHQHTKRVVAHDFCIPSSANYWFLIYIFLFSIKLDRQIYKFLPVYTVNQSYNTLPAEILHMIKDGIHIYWYTLISIPTQIALPSPSTLSKLCSDLKLCSYRYWIRRRKWSAIKTKATGISWGAHWLGLRRGWHGGGGYARRVEWSRRDHYGAVTGRQERQAGPWEAQNWSTLLVLVGEPWEKGNIHCSLNFL